ncbi:MAG: diguanylate cyclase [Burkholderiales bacterium]
MTRLRIGPVARIALALATMAAMLVVVAGALLQVSGNGGDDRTRLRRSLADSIALQGAALIQRGDLDTLRDVLRTVVANDPRLGSIAFRRAGGGPVAAAGDPGRWWRPPEGDAAAADADRIRVPLYAGNGHWGDLEIAWKDGGRGGALDGWLGHPLVVTAAFVFAAGALGFGLFMRRVLQHLDPSAAIPERVRTAFDTLVEGIAILDGEGRIVLANQAFRTLRRDVDVRDGLPLSSMSWRLADSPRDASHPWVDAMNQSRVVAGVGMRAGDGENARDVLVTCSPIRDGRGQMRGCLVSFADVTEIGRANAQLRGALADLEQSRTEIEAKNRALQRAATRDPLTECLNRRAFADLGEPVHRAARGPAARPASALLLDIDHFKSVNDRFGHATGDRVIRTVGATLQSSVRPNDLVARHGGEEFAVLLVGSGLDEAMVIAERIRALVADRCRLELADVPGLQVTVSIGVSDTTLGGPTLEALLDQADTALYRAKRAGRNRVLPHEPEPPAEAPTTPAAAPAADATSRG